MLRQLSIKTRVLLVTAILTAILAGTTLYMTGKLADNSRAVAKTAELAQLSELAGQIRSTFGEYRYWLTDLAVSLLLLSETNANAAKERLAGQLDELARTRPELAATIKQEVTQFETNAMRAVDEYTNDKRVVGNTFLAAARQHSIAIDARIASFVEGLNREAAQARSQVQADVAQTTVVAAIAVGITILLGIAATFVVLRSISRPLDDVVAAMAGITAGNLDASIPRSAPDEIGAMARTLELFRDSLTERNRLAAEREKERETLAAAIATISDGFVLYDANDRIVVCNERVREIYSGVADLFQPGISFREILDAAVARSVPALNERAPEEWVQERLRQHSKQYSVAEYSYRNDLWVRVTERKTHDGGAVVVYTDITELKQRQRELEKAMQQAEAANRAKSAFLANMSHELRTPLNAIIGLTEMLVSNAARFGTEKATEPLRRVHRAGKHLLELINQVLDLSKIEAGKLELNPERVNIPRLVDEVVGTARSLAEQNKNHLTVECPSDIAPLYVDAIASAANPAQSSEQCLQVHQGWRGFVARDPGDRRRPGVAGFCRDRQRDRNDPRPVGQTFPGVHAGRPIDRPPLRRHRPRTSDYAPALPHDGWRRDGHERGRQRLDVRRPFAGRRNQAGRPNQIRRRIGSAGGYRQRTSDDRRLRARHRRRCNGARTHCQSFA
jgi:adenylate cyclase